MATAAPCSATMACTGAQRSATPRVFGSRRLPRTQRPSRMQVRAAAAEVKEEALSEDEKIAKMLAKPYKYGFKTIIESESFPKGLSEDVVRAISAKKDEPEWMLDFRCRPARTDPPPPPPAASFPGKTTAAAICHGRWLAARCLDGAGSALLCTAACCHPRPSAAHPPLFARQCPAAANPIRPLPPPLHCCSAGSRPTASG